MVLYLYYRDPMAWARATIVSAVFATATMGFAGPAGASETTRDAESIESIESIESPIANALPAQFATACPEMTDSVARLYSAFFLRLPDQTGWDYWLPTYVNPTTDLLDIAEAFVASDEFQKTYGALTNEQFVTLVYNNVLGRDPDAGGFTHWTSVLDGGFARGALMLAFSESEEYVKSTETFVPLAGYLQSYTPSVEFRCGQGAGGFFPVADHKFADAIVWNTGDTDLVYYESDFDTNGNAIAPVERTLAPGHYLFQWNIDLAAAGRSALGVAGPASPDFWWTIVYYPHPHSADRPGYE
ncbi:MAG: DUF4214 domain-containing protein [Acidimicrobiales bacterium]